MRGLVLLVAAVVVPTRLLAAISCSDEPGFEGLGCRIAAAREKAGEDDSLARRLDTIDRAVAHAATICARGDTRATRARLRTLRGRFAAATRLAGDDVVADLRLADAIRRATASRLLKHPCPELVEVLAPAPGDDVSGDLYVLVRLTADADPTTLQGSMGATPLVFAPGDVSTTQAHTRVACDGETLVVRVASRSGDVEDEERVPVDCGPTGFGLGGEVEVLATHDHVPETLRLEPVRPLRSGGTYAVVVTRAMTATRGRRLAPSDDFRAAIALSPARGSGPTAYWSTTANDPRNPFPSERLVQPDGTIRIPDGFTDRAVPAVPRLDGLRAFLHGLDALTNEHRGFSPSTPVVLTFDAPVDLERARPPFVLVVELRNPGPPGTNLGPLLDALERERGISRDAIAVASVFAIEDYARTMVDIRAQLASRALPVVDFTDPNPGDTVRFGVYRPGDVGFADFFPNGAPPSVGAVARGRFGSPDYRETGRFPDRFLDGSVEPPLVPIEFLLAVPAAASPSPVVILQHGFCGNHGIVTQNAAEFTTAGLAVIGIPAPEHGPRGNCFDYFDFDDFNAFGNNFRQSSVDLLQLVRLITAGVDLDGDTNSDLLATDIGYLGISLGGVIGGTFASVEPAIRAAVLNVPGGKLSQLAGASSPFAEPFLGAFATAAGLSTRVCGGDPTAAACTTDATCGGTRCLRNPDFTLLLEAGALDWQSQLDPGDGATYARALRLAPANGTPRAVLVQEGLGDEILANPLTEALARAIGLASNRPDAATGGVAGLWRFPPPQGHGIFGLASVRGQAIGFLASGGQTIGAP